MKIPRAADGRVDAPVGEEGPAGVVLQEPLSLHHRVPTAQLHVLWPKSIEKKIAKNTT